MFVLAEDKWLGFKSFMSRFMSYGLCLWIIIIWIGMNLKQVVSCTEKISNWIVKENRVCKQFNIDFVKEENSHVAVEQVILP